MAVLQFPLTHPPTRKPHNISPTPIRQFAPTAIRAGRLAQPGLAGDMPGREALLERLRIVGELAPRATLSFLAVEVSGLYRVLEPPADGAATTLLEAVAAGVRGATRSTDMAGMLGASTFGVVLQGTGEKAAGAVAARLSAFLNELAAGWPGAAVHVSAATGTGVNALVLMSAALDSSADCC